MLFRSTGATGATVTGLPAGVTGTWSNNVVTISGTPTQTGSFTYSITMTGGGTCTGSVTSGNIVVSSGACTCLSYPLIYASTTGDEEISNVTVGSMNNSSNCSTTASGSGSLNQLYSNYSGVLTGPIATKGSSVSFSLTQTTCGGNYNNFFQIYVDWNQDGDWLDAGEQVYSQASSVSGNQTVTGSFTIPCSALTGVTRMRVVNIENTASTTNYAHTSYFWGETEDYCFTVNPSVNEPTVSYSGSPYNFCLNSAITNLTPTTTNSPNSFTINPALPTGLNFNSANGVISGTPTSVSSLTTYTITASNGTSACSGQNIISIQVKPIPTNVNAGYDVAICSGSSTTLSVSSTSNGVPLNSSATLSNVLAALNANSSSLIASIPSGSGFAMDATNGVNATNILDGGGDMYDGGNYINTNLATGLVYSDNAVIKIGRAHV